MVSSNRVSPERLAYYLILFMMAVSMTGVWLFRYAIYAAPVFVFLLWLMSGNLRLRFNWDLVPFYLLIVASLVNVMDWNFDSIKKLIFISVYVSVFTLFDFRRIKIDVLRLGIFFVFLFLLRSFFEGRLDESFQYSLMDSKSTLENTMAFPFGLIALFFMLNKRYILFGIFAALVMLSLKRIVLLGLVVALTLAMIPRRIRPLIINPYMAVTVTLTVLFIAVYFAQGSFDHFIMKFAGMSPDQLSEGRQVLWASLLKGAHYRFQDFILFGLGNGSSLSILQKVEGNDHLLVHNDVLSIYIDYGLVILTIFIFTLNKQKFMTKRVMAMYISVVFITDNVLIYQHVMMTYLLLMAQLERQELEKEAVRKARAVNKRRLGIGYGTSRIGFHSGA